jgi:hypothetical protein
MPTTVSVYRASFGECLLFQGIQENLAVDKPRPGQLERAWDITGIKLLVTPFDRDSQHLSQFTDGQVRRHTPSLSPPAFSVTLNFYETAHLHQLILSGYFTMNLDGLHQFGKIKVSFPNNLIINPRKQEPLFLSGLPRRLPRRNEVFVLKFMENKQCSHCKQIKPLDLFYKHKCAKTGIRSECIECSKRYPSYQNKYLRKVKQQRPYSAIRTSFKVFVNKMYDNMYCRVKNYSGKHASYKGLEICSRAEFKNFALNNKQLIELYQAWQKNNYHQHFLPTPDRINRILGYSLNNIQFLTYIENTRKH